MAKTRERCGRCGVWLRWRRLTRGEQLPEVRESVLHLLVEGLVGFALGGVPSFELLLLGVDLRLQGIKARFVPLH